MLCLVRPDGVVWGAGLVLIRMFQCKNFDEFKGELSRGLSWLVVPGLIYFMLRYWYFGELFPLPFLVKSSGQANLLIFHLGSLQAIGVVLLPVILTVIANLKDKKEATQFILLFLLPVIFYACYEIRAKHWKPISRANVFRWTVSALTAV